MFAIVVSMLFSGLVGTDVLMLEKIGLSKIVGVFGAGVGDVGTRGLI